MFPVFPAPRRLRCCWGAFAGGKPLIGVLAFEDKAVAVPASFDEKVDATLAALNPDSDFSDDENGNPLTWTQDPRMGISEKLKSRKSAEQAAPRRQEKEGTRKRIFLP